LSVVEEAAEDIGAGISRAAVMKGNRQYSRSEGFFGVPFPSPEFIQLQVDTDILMQYVLKGTRKA